MTDQRSYANGRPAAGGWRFSVAEVMAALGVYDAITIAGSLDEPQLAEELERVARQGDFDRARELVAAVNSLLGEAIREAAAARGCLIGDPTAYDEYLDWDWRGLPEEGDGYYLWWEDDPAESLDSTLDDEPEPEYVVKFRQPFIASGHEADYRSYKDDGQHGRNHRTDPREKAIRRHRRSPFYIKR